MLKQFLNNRKYFRITLTLLLGFSSGLPLALTGTALQAWFTVSGIDLVTIGMLGLVGQPYLYKFFWSPLVDRYKLPFLDRRRSWMLVTQVGLMVSLGIMSFLNPQTASFLLACLALLVAFLSATQDIAVDAYRTEILHPNERAVGAAMYTGGYRMGMLVSSGVALILADKLGWHITYLIMASLMVVGMICVWLAPTPEDEYVSVKAVQFSTSLLDPLREFWQRNHAGWLILFIVFYKFGEALASALTTTFLLGDLGFTLTVVGGIYKTLALTATILGAFIGGALFNRLGLFRALWWFGILQAIAVLTYMMLAMTGKNYMLMVSAVFLETFCAGMSTNAFVVLLMSLCDHRYTATQFALLSAVAAFGRITTGPIAGFLVKSVGWPKFFLLSFVVCIPGLILLRYLRQTIAKVEEGDYSSTPVLSSIPVKKE